MKRVLSLSMLLSLVVPMIAMEEKRPLSPPALCRAAPSSEKPVEVDVNKFDAMWIKFKNDTNSYSARAFLLTQLEDKLAKPSEPVFYPADGAYFPLLRLLKLSFNREVALYSDIAKALEGTGNFVERFGGPNCTFDELISEQDLKNAYSEEKNRYTSHNVKVGNENVKELLKELEEKEEEAEDDEF